MIPILSGNVATAIGGAYEVANSCRFNKADSAYMTKTPSGAGNQRTWTFSAWVKRSQIHSAGDQIFQQSASEGNYMKLYFYANKIYWRAQTSESNTGYIVTNRLFRDISAWYHIVARFDSTNATAGDRMRLYINGVEETSFSTDTNPALNYDSYANTTNAIDIGRDNLNATSYFDGYMAEVCMVDGQSLAPTSFGEFDDDSPTIWKPKDVSGLTFGTNGFYLDFEDSSNLGNDANGGTDFTENNLAATDQATDTPTNSFATFNPLLDVNNPPTFSEGNLKAQGSSSGTARFSGSTICVSNGKWYYEVKVTVGSSSPYVGVIDAQSNMRRQGIYFVNSDADSDNPSGFAVNMSGDIYHNNSNSYATNIGSISTDDILGFKIDMDASPKTCEILKNGSSQRTFNLDEPPSGFYMLGCISIYNQASAIAEINYGSPSFTISSGNSDANGYGNFEYSVPDGFLALCTKNLGSDGG